MNLNYIYNKTISSSVFKSLSKSQLVPTLTMRARSNPAECGGGWLACCSKPCAPLEASVSPNNRFETLIVFGPYVSCSRVNGLSFSQTQFLISS